MKCLACRKQTLEGTVSDMFSLEDYKFTCDWLNVRLDCDDINYLIARICVVLPELTVNDFEVRPSGGVCFYKKAHYLPKCGYSSVVLAYNTDDSGYILNESKGMGHLFGVLVSISGDGCRFINSLHENAFLDLIKLFSEEFNPHCSRIDVACDILDKDNPIVPMIQTFAYTAYRRDEATIDFNCNIPRRPGWVTCNDVFDNSLRGWTKNVTIGGRNSTKGTLQLYNKRVEIESGRLSEYKAQMLEQYGNPDYWWRLEYRCKSFAQMIFETLVQSGDIVKAFLAAAERFGKFTESLSDSSHISRELTLAEWVVFLAFLKKISSNAYLVQFKNPVVSQKYVSTTISKLEHYQLENMAVQTVVTLLHSTFDEDFRNRLLRKGLNDFLYKSRYVPLRTDFCRIHSLKLEDLHDLAFEQMGFYDNEDIA